MALGTRMAGFCHSLFRGSRAHRGPDAGVRAGAGLETAVRDLRYGLRALARTPGLTAAMILVLALGIGASTAVFSVVNAVLLRPLPYDAAERLVVILHGDRNPVAPANYLDWRRAARHFERMGAAEVWSPSLTGDGHPERVRALRVTADILPMLGVVPAAGRPLLDGEDHPGSDHVVVLGDELWRTRYAGDPGILGRSITLDGEGYTVVGVMPAGFSFPPFWATGTQLWAPLSLQDRASNRGGSSLRVFGRLRHQVTLAEARAEMATITARLEAAFPGTNRGVGLRPMIDVVVGDVRPALLVLLGAVGFVLLVTCTNVAHMLLARAAARRKEMALRAALGASRVRVLRQLLTESLVLAAAGGAAGVLLARGGIRVLVALAPPGVPRLEWVALDASVLAFALVLTLATGFAFGIVPALQATGRDLGDSLREGKRGSTAGGGGGVLRSALVASEFALALVLLVGAGLTVRSFLALQAVDPGFDRRNVLSLIVSVAGTAAAEPGRRAAFFRDVVRDASALPGVASASAINHLPLAGDTWGWPFRVEGRPEPKPGESPTATYRVVLPGYFRTMGVPLRRGRDVSDQDRAGAPGVVVVNESLAARHWPGQDPIGKRLALSDREPAPTWLTVVGVVKDTVRSRWGAPPEDEIFLPYPQARRYVEDPSSHFAYLTLVVRTAEDPASLAAALRNAVWAREPDAPISDVRVLEEVVKGATARPRFYVILLGAFAAVALTLAAVGIYAVISFSVARRTNEIGLRMALGAEPGDVLRLVVGHGLLVGLVGALAGVLGALALSRLMSTMLYGVGSRDPATFGGVLVLLGAVAFLASYLPARRATRIDPLQGLRSD